MLGTFLIHFGDLIKLIPATLRSLIFFDVIHCDLKVSRSQAKTMRVLPITSLKPKVTTSALQC